MRRLDGITSSIDMNLSQFWETLAYEEHSKQVSRDGSNHAASWGVKWCIFGKDGGEWASQYKWCLPHKVVMEI